MALFIIEVDSTYGATWFAVAEGENEDSARGKARVRYPLSDQYMDPQQGRMLPQLPEAERKQANHIADAEIRLDASGVSQLLEYQW